ncbi:MAG: DNA topoisomerase VI subunit B, partial [Planctomycetota bacterium]
MAKRKAAKSKPAARKKSAAKSPKRTVKKAKKAKTAKKSARPKATQRKATPKAKTTAPAEPVVERTTEAAPKKKPQNFATAETMAKSQRSISVSEFFAKNLAIRIEQVSETHFRVSVQDNGPGIVRKQIPSIFGQLLYGSKFHRLRMSRGQQGIGISAAGMYGLLTTGRPVTITSRTGPRAKAHHYELQINTRTNRPDVIKDNTVDWDVKHGTKVEIELEAKYQRGRQSVDDYLEQTAIANPHVTLHYTAPDGREETYKASIKTLPATPKTIRPHPHGIELGVLLKMAADTKARTSQQFLTGEFSRVSPRVAQQILQAAELSARIPPKKLDGEEVKRIYQAIQDTKIMAPATDCVVPIGEEQLIAGLKHVVEAEFYTACTRSPAVYRGNPFVIEAALAYGRPETPADAKASGNGDGQTPPPDDDEAEAETQLAKVIRFANRVPLQYQQGACAITKSVVGLNWKSYALSQSRGALPSGPMTIVVHMASVWVPFTSESKEAVASYPEIIKDIRLALQECGRKLGAHIRKRVRINRELKKRSYIEKYIPAIGEAMRDILTLKDRQVS